MSYKWKNVIFLLLNVSCLALFSQVLEVPDHNPLMGIIGLKAGQLYTVVNSLPYSSLVGEGAPGDAKIIPISHSQLEHS